MREIPFITDYDVVNENFISPSKFIDTIFSNYIKVIGLMNKTYNDAVKSNIKAFTQLIDNDASRTALGAFNGEFPFAYTDYKYDIGIPSEDPIRDWINSYEALQARLTSLEMDDVKKLKEGMDDYKFAEAIRGGILKTAPVPVDAFKEKANKLFVKGDKEVLVDKKFIMNIIKSRGDVVKKLDAVYKDGLRLHAIVGEIEEARNKLSRAGEIELKSDLLKVSNLSTKYKGKLTKEQKIIAYNLDVIFLQVAHNMLSLMSLVHNMKIHAALTSVKQDMHILNQAIKLQKS